MTRSLASAALLSVLLCVRAFSAAPHPDKTESDPRYDPVTVIHVTGTVISVHEVPANNPLGGLHLLIGTDTAEIETYLGPVDFLKQFEISFSDMSCWLVRCARGEVCLYLRDNSGHPNWPTRWSPTT